jgi:hypothetical protein
MVKHRLRCWKDDGDQVPTMPVSAHWRGNSRPEQRRAAPDVFAFDPANGGYHRSIETAILKGLVAPVIDHDGNF